jgi:hypothetical protein
MMVAALGAALVFGSAPVLADTAPAQARPVLTQVSQLIRAEACSDCAAIEVAAQAVEPAKRKIKVKHYWRVGVLH